MGDLFVGKAGAEHAEHPELLGREVADPLRDLQILRTGAPGSPGTIAMRRADVAIEDTGHICRHQACVG